MQIRTPPGLEIAVAGHWKIADDLRKAAADLGSLPIAGRLAGEHLPGLGQPALDLLAKIQNFALPHFRNEHSSLSGGGSVPGRWSV
ncbi:MAG TPA: hypothetical protein VME92_15135 [Acetobacteraceae bacterium]|nr:hypothetical protein [Acetobacteraceae bacterium]